MSPLRHLEIAAELLQEGLSLASSKGTQPVREFIALAQARVQPIGVLVQRVDRTATRRDQPLPRGGRKIIRKSSNSRCTATESARATAASAAFAASRPIVPAFADPPGDQSAAGGAAGEQRCS